MDITRICSKHQTYLENDTKQTVPYQPDNSIVTKLSQDAWLGEHYKISHIFTYVFINAQYKIPKWQQPNYILFYSSPMAPL